MTYLWVHFGLGSALVIAGWLLVRALSRAYCASALGLIVDGLLPFAAFLVILTATARPLSAALIVFGLLCAYGAADRAKRAILNEPIVFTDLFQTVDVILRHPEINLLFNGTRCIALGGLALGGLSAAALLWEPPAWRWSPWPGLVALAAVGLCAWAMAGPLLTWSHRVLNRLQAVGEPMLDAERLGPFAMQLVYCLVARAERSRRRAAAIPVSSAKIKHTDLSGPVVVVQCEAFFDPRRLHPKLPCGLLPNFEACLSSGVQWGRLAVPGTGANSVRTEFAVLTGLSERAVGFDRFNPYLAFARSPVRSLAWQARAAGYRTICIHPFDRRFYRRDRVMANLGFDCFISEEAFSGADRIGAYVADVELARITARMIAEHGPKVFVFAITIQNHGPWVGSDSEERAAAMAYLPDLPDKEALNSFLHGTNGADAMLGTLIDCLQKYGASSLLAFYGDHLPGLKALAQLDFRDTRTDYVIWRPGDGTGLRQDLAAHDLSHAIWAACGSACSTRSAVPFNGALAAEPRVGRVLGNPSKSSGVVLKT
jgi:hypothetical protein